MKNLTIMLVLRFLYLLLAKASFIYGVFLIGVRMIGDNPGALFGGALTFLSVYIGCVMLETLIKKLWLERESMVASLFWSCGMGGVALLSLFVVSLYRWDFPELTTGHYALIAVMLVILETTGRWLLTKGATYLDRSFLQEAR